jgi:hypothetical protein
MEHRNEFERFSRSRSAIADPWQSAALIFSAFLRCQRPIILSGIGVLADTRAPSCEIVMNINDDLPKLR